MAKTNVVAYTDKDRFERGKEVGDWLDSLAGVYSKDEVVRIVSEYISYKSTSELCFLDPENKISSEDVKWFLLDNQETLRKLVLSFFDAAAQKDLKEYSEETRVKSILNEMNDTHGKKEAISIVTSYLNSIYDTAWAKQASIEKTLLWAKLLLIGHKEVVSYLLSSKKSREKLVSDFYNEVRLADRKRSL